MRREAPLGEDPEPSILIPYLQDVQLMFYVCPRAEESSNTSHIIQFTESLQ